MEKEDLDSSKRFALELLKNWSGIPEKMISVSEKILSEFETAKPISSIRYKLGEVYANAGKFKKAEEVWSAFKGPQSDFWNNLAKEQIKHDSWNTDYRRYRGRIPAMSQEESN